MSQFNLLADSNLTLTTEQVDTLLDQFAHHHVAVGATEIGTTRLILTVEAEGFSSASALAYEIALEAFGAGNVESLTVMNTKWFDTAWSRG